MNKVISFLLLAVCLCACHDINFSQQLSPKPSGASAVIKQTSSLRDVLAKENNFISLENFFGIALSERINYPETISVDQPDFKIRGSAYTWDFSEGVIVISTANFYLNNSVSLTIEQGLAENVAGLRKRILAGLKAELLSQTPIKTGEYSGVKLDFSLPSGKKIKTRLYAIDGIRYDQLLAVINSDSNNNETEKIIEQTFDTFKILSQTDVNAEIKRKAEAATPVALPQEAIGKISKPDTKNDNLKGKVKNIFDETEGLSGKAHPKGRFATEEDFFNKEGNRVKNIHYDYRGNPDKITVYGYLDGAKVSKSAYLRYEYNPPAPLPIPVPFETVQKKRDLRYEYKYVNKYDEKKRLKESLLCSNDGELIGRDVFNYDDNKGEKITYNKQNVITYKTNYTLDDKGNLVEGVSTRIRTQGEEKYEIRYRYDEFDAHGNWIKRTILKPVTKDEKTTFEPTSIEYRKISYY